MKKFLIIIFLIFFGMYLYNIYSKHMSNASVEKFNKDLENSRKNEMEAIEQQLKMQEGLQSDVETSKTPNIPAFYDVPKLIDELNLTGAGTLRSYKRDEIGYMSSTDYYRFGSENSTGLQNNLAYYLEGSSIAKVDRLKIILNIFNNSERKDALRRYSDLTTRAFRTINVEEPQGLNAAILKGQDFSFENEKYSVITKKMPGNIDNYKLTIEEK